MTKPSRLLLVTLAVLVPLVIVVSASGSSRRARSTTFAPARARARAIARPMPELPPVTRATLPCSENSEDRKPWSERGPGANE